GVQTCALPIYHAAEHAGAEHRPFQRSSTVDPPARHPAHLAGGEQAVDRVPVDGEHPAVLVGADTAEVLTRQREELNREERWLGQRREPGENATEVEVAGESAGARKRVVEGSGVRLGG